MNILISYHNPLLYSSLIDLISVGSAVLVVVVAHPHHNPRPAQPPPHHAHGGHWAVRGR